MHWVTICEILGTVIGLAGAICQTRRSFKVKFWGFVLFVISDGFLAAMGVHDNHFLFAFLQTAFGVISTYGAWAHRPSTWKSNG